jgi:hypothetical protein
VIWLETLKTEKGLAATWWAFKDTYQEALEQIAHRPTYRAMERKGKKRLTSMWGIGDADPVEVWRGNDLKELRQKFSANSFCYNVHDGDMHAFFFEIEGRDGKWQKCDDPR